MRLPFSVASYSHRALPVSAQRVINVMAEPQPETAKARVVLLPTPGLRLFGNTFSGPVRGMHVMGAGLYVVSGAAVYLVTLGGGVANLGVIPGTGPVSLDSDGESLCIVVPQGGQAFVVSRSAGTLTPITHASYQAATGVTVIDGYFVFTKANSTEFFLSAINDPLTFNALDFASAEGAPDNLIAPTRVGRDLWLFGERTIEVWSNVGAVDFPFLRVSGGFISRGAAAQFSIATRLGGALWLGDDRVVYLAQGVQPQRISTFAVEQAIGGYERVDDAVGFVYELEGHAFYCLTFPSAGDTWVFDLSAGLWHERESEGAGVWRALLSAPFAGGVVCGDAVDGRLWLIDPTFGLEGEAQIIRVATGTAFHAEGAKVGFTRLSVDFEAGVGLGTGQGSDPQAWLSWSNDGGHTWGNESVRGMGRQGQYRTRMEWRRLGQSRDRVFRLQWADPVYTSVIAVNIEAEAGDG